MVLGEAITIGPDSITGRAVCERRSVHIEDVQVAEAEVPQTNSARAKEWIRIAYHAGNTTAARGYTDRRYHDSSHRSPPIL